MNLRFQKKYLLILSFLIIAAICWRIPHLRYGQSQIRGQLKILWEATPIDTLLNNRSIADSVKYKLRLVQQIKAYAFDSLGLKKSKAYTNVYNQYGKPTLQNITACQPYKLQDYTWFFPILGEVSYKGFFDSTLLKQEVDYLKSQNLDINIREVSAWSTLGWFNDPILTNFLNRSEGQIANLIIHELTHTTIFIKDDIYFNENLASFIGDQGAKLFLRTHFGQNSKEYKEYIIAQKNDSIITHHVLQASNSLDLLYQGLSKNTDYEKELMKEQFMKNFSQTIQSLTLLDNKKYRINKKELNNTYFQAFRRYNNQQGDFKTDVDTFKDLPTYIRHIKEKYD